VNITLSTHTTLETEKVKLFGFQYEMATLKAAAPIAAITRKPFSWNTF